MAELSHSIPSFSRKTCPKLSLLAAGSPIYADGRGVIEYRASGDASSPVVLMLHGLVRVRRDTVPNSPGYPGSFHVIAWNAPGFGTSSPMSGHSAGIDDYADALESLLRALRVKRLAALVGSSWGSIVALAFARRYPALVAVSSFPLPTSPKVVSSARPAMPSWSRGFARRIPAFRFRARTVADRLLTPNTPLLVRQHVERLRDAMTNVGWANDSG